MPFSVTTGLYTPPAGATNATTGQVIQSAVWNTVHADLSAAINSLDTSFGGPFSLAPSSPTVGMIRCFTDATVNAWGSAVTVGGGTLAALCWFNKTLWKVIGQ